MKSGTQKYSLPNVSSMYSMNTVKGKPGTACETGYGRDKTVRHCYLVAWNVLVYVVINCSFGIATLDHFGMLLLTSRKMRISLDNKGRLIFMHRHCNYSPNAFKSAMFQKYFLWSLATNALKAQLSISLGVKRKTRIQCCSGMDI